MPELPEVETVRRGLAPHLSACKVRAVVARVPALRWPIPSELATLISGAALQGLSRRGKYLLFEFPAGWLIVHLGMSGSLRWVDCEEPVRKHDHFDLVLDHGIVRLHDPRRFGAVLWHARAAGPVAHHALFAGLGLEPLETSTALLAKRLFEGTRGRHRSIKAVLLAGELIVGAGNIYACESLHRARIHPASRAGRLSSVRCQRLVVALQETLEEALRRGGSSLRDFVGSDGVNGHYQHEALVYDREGLACRRCAGTVRRIVQQQRSTYYCPGCQH